MSKKSWLIPLILVIIFAACSYYYYTKHRSYSTVVHPGTAFPVLTTILPDFPAGLPVPSGVQLIGYRDSTTTSGGSNSSFQYMSSDTLVSVMASYMKYFTDHGWTTTTLSSPTGSQAVSAKYPGQTLQVSAITAGTQLVVSLAETKSALNTFPTDLPIESGATAVTNSIATSTKSIITYVRDYTSAQTLAVDYQAFSSYFTKGGFHVGPGPVNNGPTSMSITATKGNQEYQVVFAEDPKTTTVYVDVRLTFYLAK